MMKKNKKLRYDLSRVSGGLKANFGKGSETLGNINLIDNSKEEKIKIETGIISSDEKDINIKFL